MSKVLGLKFSAVLLLQKFLLVLLLASVVSAPVRAQDKQLDAIAAAVKSGNAATVARYFGASVDITLNSSSSTYSHTQGEQVLRDFFNKHRVRDFKIDFSGNSTSSDSRFSIGTLRTDTGSFKVYLFLRPADKGYIIKEIRFEK